MSVYNSNEESEKSNDVENEEEELDPRIQYELERLNKSCADVNQLENELEEAKLQFISSKNKQLDRLNYLQKKYGSSIIKAKPFYESVTQTEKLQIETQNAVHEFQKTNSLYKTAKETLTVAENSLEQSGEIPDAWQEHLSLTITKISLSKEAADRAEKYHKSKALEYQKSEQRSQLLEKELRKYIIKSQLYFDEKTRWNLQMETQKSHINEIEQNLAQTKKIYKEAMANLSNISEEIHNKRKLDKMLKNSLPSASELELGAGKSKFDSQLNSETQSLSNESQSSEAETKKLKNFLNLYNLTFPEKSDKSNSDSNYHSLQDSTTKTYDELKNCEASEYISLGLNSTASNSRSISPSNSLENEIEWKKSISENNDNNNNNNDSDIHKNEGNQLKLVNSQSLNSQLCSNTPSFCSSSLSQSSSELPNQFYNHSNKSPHLVFSNNLGMSSLTLKSPDQSNQSAMKPEDVKKLHELNITPTLKSNNRQSNKQSKLNKTTKNETPLLSSLLLQHSARF